MEVVEYISVIFFWLILFMCASVGVVAFVDNYIEHKKLRRIKADKKIRDEAYDYWKREKVFCNGNTPEHRYVCPVCVVTLEKPSRYCPDCGTRLKIK